MTHPQLAGLAAPGTGVAAPLALALAARIQERDWHRFLHDATQLANGCRDLVDAVSPNLIIVTSCAVLTTETTAESLADSAHWSAALEAVGRLSTSLTVRAAVGVHLPAPSTLVAAGRSTADAQTELTDAGRAALDAGAHVVVVARTDTEPDVSLTTLANIAAFHQGFAIAAGNPFAGLPGSSTVALDAPVPATGLVLTKGELARDTDVSVLSDWVYEVTG